MTNTSEEVSNWIQGLYKVRRSLNALLEGIQHVRIDIGTGTSEQTVDATHPLPTTATISGTPDVNIAQYGGTNTTLGQKLPNASIPVVLSCMQDDGFYQSAPTVPIGIYSDSAGQWVGWNGSVTVSSLPYSAAALPTYGKIAGTSLTTTYATLLTMSADARGLTIMNSCDQAVIITLDNGTTNNIELDAYESITEDYAALGRYLTSSTIKAKHAGTLPKVGSVRCWVKV